MKTCNHLKETVKTCVLYKKNEQSAVTLLSMLTETKSLVRKVWWSRSAFSAHAH